MVGESVNNALFLFFKIAKLEYIILFVCSSSFLIMFTRLGICWVAS